MCGTHVQYVPRDGRYALMCSMHIAPAPCFADLCANVSSRQSTQQLGALPIWLGGEGVKIAQGGKNSNRAGTPQGTKNSGSTVWHITRVSVGLLFGFLVFAFLFLVLCLVKWIRVQTRVPKPRGHHVCDLARASARAKTQRSEIGLSIWVCIYFLTLLTLLKSESR